MLMGKTQAQLQGEYKIREWLNRRLDLGVGVG